MKLRLTHTQAGTAVDRREYARPKGIKGRELTQEDIDYATYKAKDFVRGYAEIELLDDKGKMIDMDCIIV